MTKSYSDMQQILRHQLDATCRKILDVQQTSGDDEEICETTYRLQDESNALSDEILDKSRGIYPDPLDAFPPEVWQQIIFETIGNKNSVNGIEAILSLTLVSAPWLHKLTGNPLFWTKIHLDGSTSDNAAKVATCLELSKECPIDLSIYDYTYDDWVKISPLVLPHIGRVESLLLHGLHEITILNSIPILPNLRVFNCDAFDIGSDSSAHVEAIQSIDRSRMPQLERVPNDMIHFPLITSSWLDVAESLRLRADDGALSDDLIDCLTQAPRLRHVSIWEGAELDVSRSREAKGPLPALKSMTYRGPNITRMLGFISRSLTHLTVECSRLDFLWDLVSIAQQIPLSNLTIWHLDYEATRNSGSSEQNRVVHRPELLAPGVKHLWMVYPNAKTGTGYDDWVYSMHRIVVHAFVGVESLGLSGGTLTPQIEQYIGSLPSLQDLNLCHCVVHEAGPLSMRAPRSLKAVTCYDIGLSLPIDPIGGVNFGQSMLILLLRRREEPSDDGSDILPLIHCDPHTESGSNIALSLANSFPSKSLFDISSIVMRETLSLYRGDLLEWVALRPGDFPGLGDIQLNQGPLELDLLILMLERRNLRPQSSVSHTTSLRLQINPPKPLQHVLLSLLAGRYPVRRSLQAYSLDAVGKRMFDPTLSGCYNCCFFFRNCDRAPQPPAHETGRFPSFHESLEQLVLNYALPHEAVVAEPPLTKRDTRWLAGVKGRRRDFKEGYLKSLFVLSREESCDEYGFWSSLHTSRSDDHRV